MTPHQPADKPRKSIVAQLTTWYVSSLFVLVLATSIYLYWTLSSAILAESRAVLLDRIHTVTSLLERSPDSLEYARSRIRLEWPSRHFERVYVRVVKNGSAVLLESPSIPPEVVTEVFGGDAGDTPQARRVRTRAGGVYLAASNRLKLPGGEPATAYVALDLSRQDEILSRYRDRLFAALFCTLLVASLFGRKLARQAIRPVEDIVRTARHIRSTTLHERIEERGLPEELQRLAATINEMLDRLEDAFERLSRFSSDIAHELRTPLNNIRGEIEVALGRSRTLEEYREVLASSLEESARVSKLIDGLLFLAKTEHPEMQIRKERVNLHDEIANIRDFYEASAAEEEVEIDAVIAPALEVEVERTLFQRALGNLVANAIAYNRPGGRIRVEAERRGTMVEISVRDTGQGIAAGDLEHVFDRFYRADPSRQATKLGGFGLGLTIVRSIVQLHQGEIHIESEVGKGTCVRVSIPG
jgi:two-component system heavy metal sensor histidine kinase CusS